MCMERERSRICKRNKWMGEWSIIYDEKKGMRNGRKEGVRILLEMRILPGF